MSDVDAVSLPAALDVGQNTLAVKPELGPPPRNDRADSRVDQNVHSEEEGPPSPRADSEAETIIQSGRESLSPEKKRKHIKHDPNRRELNGVDGHRRKKSRTHGEHGRERERDRSRSRALSPSMVKIEKSDDADGAFERPRTFRKRSFSDSEEQHGRHSSHPRELKQSNNTRLSRPPSNTRSLSPNRRSHQRSASGSQFPTKKKAPTPLLTGFPRQSSEDRLSTSSSASGSPLPGLHLRKLGGTGASASPAKQMGPKKLRDKSGRTPLARACADRKHDQVMMRHAERPEDINIPDNAGNTPLQIASLAGEAEIVKFLLDAGCEINTKNIDKDTPLIDAVENGNVEVVKLLLDAGANPRTVNAEGDEPYELVPSFVDEDEYDEMRKAIADAKANLRPSRRSEEHMPPENREPSSRRTSAARGSAASPRDSPPMRSPPPVGVAGRRKGGRSEATRNDLLWTKPTFENLREFAAKGDEAGVVSILNILQKADNASLIAAAKGGHHDVLSLLYAMGEADADPNPLRGQKPGYNTPLLAAIGRGKSAVISLILSQPGFDPTRRLFEDKTYFELSRDRQGEDWEDEHKILKEAYENYSGPRKGRKGDSPRRARGKDKDDRRARKSSSPVPRARKHDTSPNATRHRDPLKEVDSIREKRREKDHDSSRLDQSTWPDSSRPDSSKPKSSLSARRDSESSGVARTDEIKKRRLIAGRRPQERRPSLFSSDSLSGREEAPRPREEASKPREEAPKMRPDNAPDSSLSLKRIRPDRSPERSRSRGTDRRSPSPGSRPKKRRVFSEDKQPGAANASNGSKCADDVIKPHPRQLHEETTRAPDPKTQHPRSSEPYQPLSNRQHSPTHDTVKKNGDMKLEPIERKPKSPEDMMANEKRAELEAKERRQAQAKKAEQERAANERRAAAEAERTRLAKEEADRAAQAARDKAEEDERKRKEAEQRRAKQAEDDRQKRLEQERARLAKMRREQEATERRRREALPTRLSLAADLVGSNDPRAKSHAWLKNFMPLVTALTRQLDPQCDVEVAEEKWIPNYLVAPLLATNDLQLSQYASWEKRKATITQRNNLWRMTRRMVTHVGEYAGHGPVVGDIFQKDCENRPKYFAMEHVFWVRLADFMELLPHVPHLHGLELQFLNMHIDSEPTSISAYNQIHHLNGHSLDGAVETNGTGLVNGHGHSLSSTYV
ncbi:hypothetical protein N7508_009426 [Penicillium antarcticum]|uniref:uncharacterized protein n=1 Tax=Penicillium antarcticum TaxID=416450 RepID=UPI0023975E59|nr:uncharacterized protein N7508_009426 [Penicillium antarcticum]KAJ5294605.1 hypothetical protein N7508_009426 [Penicillium antarcticum]